MTGRRPETTGRAIPDGGVSTPQRAEPLALYGHRIVPAEKREGSVRRWVCLDCEAAAADAESYLDVACDAA